MYKWTGDSFLLSTADLYYRKSFSLQLIKSLLHLKAAGQLCLIDLQFENCCTAITQGCLLWLPWLNRLDITPGGCKIIPHTTHIRLVNYISVFCQFMRDMTHYWGSLILSVTASYSAILVKVLFHVSCLKCIMMVMCSDDSPGPFALSMLCL